MQQTPGIIEEKQHFENVNQIASMNTKIILYFQHIHSEFYLSDRMKICSEFEMCGMTALQILTSKRGLY